MKEAIKFLKLTIKEKYWKKLSKDYIFVNFLYSSVTKTNYFTLIFSKRNSCNIYNIKSWHYSKQFSIRLNKQLIQEAMIFSNGIPGALD